MRERFQASFANVLDWIKINCRDEIISGFDINHINQYLEDFIELEVSQALAEQREEVLKVVRGMPDDMKSIMPNGKFPVVIFPVDIDDHIKWQLYEMGIKAVKSRLVNSLKDEE